MTSTAFSAIATDGKIHRDGALSYSYLPAPTVQSHAANLMTLGDGRLGCVWFGGTQEGVADISIYFSALERGEDGQWAEEWSEPQQLSFDSTRSEQNPILFPYGEELWLLYTAQHAGNQDTSEVRRRISLDHGRTWSEAETLFGASAHGGVFVRQPPIVVGERIMVPVFRCATVPGEKWVGDADDFGPHGFQRRRYKLGRAVGPRVDWLRSHEPCRADGRQLVGPVPEPLGGFDLCLAIGRRRTYVVRALAHRAAEQQLLYPVHRIGRRKIGADLQPLEGQCGYRTPAFALRRDR